MRRSQLDETSVEDRVSSERSQIRPKQCKMSHSQILERARNAFDSGKTRDGAFRKRQLEALLRMYEEKEDEFVQALFDDLKKPKQEAITMELNTLKGEVSYILAGIDNWIKPQKVPASLLTMFDKSLIYPEPYGVVLIMGAWNYPAQLSLLPLAGAIAAGNCAIIKPSEISPKSAKLIAELVPKYLDEECYHVICGGVPETTELLKERYDYIFYTGSTHVGKIVREAANKYLTPTTLELGGKSPVYIDDSVDLDMAVRRIMWGKCVNMGQTCVAPDFVLCTKALQEKIIIKAREVIKEWYGDEPQQSPHLGRIVSDRNFSRLIEYLKDGKLALGGGHDAGDRWIEPSILVDVSPESQVMKEEIFGPILPMVTIESPTDVITFLRQREKPLAFYIFSTQQSIVDILLREVPFGGCCVNDVIIHISVSELPFGGVGNSGMGSYHGKASFDTFSHNKSCLVKNYNKIADAFASTRFPPYSAKKTNILTSLQKERYIPCLKYIGYIFIFALGALSMILKQMLTANEA